MPYGGVFHCFMTFKVLEKQEKNDDIIRIAEVARYSTNRMTAEEIARDNYSRVEKMMKSNSLVEDMEVE